MFLPIQNTLFRKCVNGPRRLVYAENFSKVLKPGQSNHDFPPAAIKNGEVLVSKKIGVRPTDSQDTFWEATYSHLHLRLEGEKPHQTCDYKSSESLPMYFKINKMRTPDHP